MPSKIATSVPADNDISVKEYIKIIKYKDPEIVMTVIMGAVSMIKKRDR